MPSAIAGQELISLVQATKLFPRRPSLSTLHRWKNGIGTNGGVRLASLRIGGCWYTTEKAVEEFIADCNASDDERLAKEGC